MPRSRSPAEPCPGCPPKRCPAAALSVSRPLSSGSLGFGVLLFFLIPPNNIHSSKYFQSGACTVTPAYAWLSWSYSQVTASGLRGTAPLLCLCLGFPTDCRFCISILIFFVFQTNAKRGGSSILLPLLHLSKTALGPCSLQELKELCSERMKS